jgi:predicted SprT family Zn-dependent metalloprotease
MATAGKSTTSAAPAPPPRQVGPVIHGDQATIQRWLTHYWQKLHVSDYELSLLAITQDRKEYMHWTGKRLNTMALGCYCYVPAPSLPGRSRTSPPLLVQLPMHRHLIFIEPSMEPKSIEVTIAHELIHLADRVNGTPRRHRHHGYDSIADDEAAITGYPVEDLRVLLHEESARRERLRRERRPIRYVYECPGCGKKYPRTRRYSQSVSCSSCDKNYNPQYRLLLRS